MAELILGLTEYFIFYNEKRPHQSLSNLVPDHMYQTGKGGGAKIVDKFKSKRSREEILVETEKSKITMCKETGSWGYVGIPYCPWRPPELSFFVLKAARSALQ